jgi:hypothetical protein
MIHQEDLRQSCVSFKFMNPVSGTEWLLEWMNEFLSLQLLRSAFRWARAFFWWWNKFLFSFYSNGRLNSWMKGRKQLGVSGSHCNLSYLGGWDWEDHGLRPDGANISRDPISKINRAKLTRGVAQVVEGLLCKHEVLRSNSSLTKKKKKKALKC